MNLYTCAVCDAEHTQKEPGIPSDWIGGQCNGTQWFFICPKKDKAHKPYRDLEKKIHKQGECILS